MSRLAKKPIVLPKGVEVKISTSQVEVKGPKGTQSLELPEGISLLQQENTLQIEFDEKKLDYPFLRLYNALIKNMCQGVATGFEKKLQLIGVGYRAQVKGNQLDLQLGFSHPTFLDIPAGIAVKVEKSTLITIEGCNKQEVGQFAANIRAIRPPEPYKGKGVRYENEYVRKKAGKTAKGK